MAFESYAESAKNINDPMGKKLFKQLSDFEKFHYERISELEKSLEENGNFINYEGKEFPVPPLLEKSATKKQDQSSVVEIIFEALQLEKEAETAYANLAAQITDPQGHEMFSRLSEEEHIHHRILSEAHWSLTNYGVWKWSHRFPMIWIDRDTSSS